MSPGRPGGRTGPQGSPATSDGPYAHGPAPLVGIGLFEADDLDEAVHLVAGTPCAVAGGAVEVRPVVDVPTC